MQKRSSSYVMTISPESAIDMEQLNLVKKSVSISNKLALTKYKQLLRNFELGYRPIKPAKPDIYRVRLMARGPRRVAAINDNKRFFAYDQYLPVKHATTLDVYIHERS